MLELLFLKVKNLASHIDSTYLFKNKLDIVVGINKDLSPIEIKDMEVNSLLDLSKTSSINIPSNGSGKSVIIEGINLALFGDLIRKVSTKEIIRKGEKECEVELICKNEWLGLSQIRIIRKFFLTKSSSIEIYETIKGKENENRLSTLSDELNKRILNYYIGISKEDLINFFIIQRERYVPFLLLPDSKKKEIISKFTGIDKYSYVEDKLKSSIEDNNNKINTIEKNISKLLGKVEVLDEDIKNLPSQSSFEEKIQSKIEVYKEENKEYNKKIIEISKQIPIINKKTEILNNKYNIYLNRKDIWYKIKCNNKYYKALLAFEDDDKDIIEFENKIKNIKKEIEEGQKEIKEINLAIQNAFDLIKQNKKSLIDLQSAKSKLDLLKENSIECPKCKYKFIPKQELSLDEVNTLIKSKISSIKKKDSLIEEINLDIKELEKDIEGINKKNEEKSLQIEGYNHKKSLRLKEIESEKEKINLKINKIDKIFEYIKNQISYFKDSISNQKDNINQVETNISLLQKKIKHNEDLIVDIKNKSYESILIQKRDLEEKSKEIKKEISLLENDKMIIEKEIQNYKDSEVVFKNFKNYLYNKIIFDIEQIINYYLQKFSDFTLELKGTKLLSDGKTQRDEITVSLKRNGQEQNYFLCSSGEKTLVDLAFIFTFQHILNTSCKEGGGLNFIALDEIGSSLDGSNTSKIIDALGSLNKSVIFITHSFINLLDKNVIYIVKKDNKSNIIDYGRDI